MREVNFCVFFCFPSRGIIVRSCMGGIRGRALKLPNLDRLNSVWNGVPKYVAARAIFTVATAREYRRPFVNVLQRFCTVALGTI